MVGRKARALEATDGDGVELRGRHRRLERGEARCTLGLGAHERDAADATGAHLGHQRPEALTRQPPCARPSPSRTWGVVRGKRRVRPSSSSSRQGRVLLATTEKDDRIGGGERRQHLPLEVVEREPQQRARGCDAGALAVLHGLLPPAAHEGTHRVEGDAVRVGHLRCVDDSEDAGGGLAKVEEPPARAHRAGGQARDRGQRRWVAIRRAHRALMLSEQL
jgi:hypothetical protein